MTLRISDSTQSSTNQTNSLNMPEKVLVTLSGVNASSEEEAAALLKALGFTQADLDAFKEKYGKDLKKFFADEFAKQPSRITRDASSKPGFQAYIGINSHNYKLLTAFIAERRGTKNDHLKNQSKQTAAEKRVYDNSAVQAGKLRDLADKAGVLTTSIGNPNKLDELRHFSVTIRNETKTSDSDAVLTALIEREFGDRIPFAENRNQILNIAKQSGVAPKNISINGNRAEFDLTLEDTLKLKIAYNHIKDGLNRADAARLDVVNNNMFSQFVAGMFEGAKDSVAGTANIILDPVGTAKALWQVIGSPIETYNALYAELEKSWDKFQAADYVERSRMMGHLVGSVVTGILISKGAGELGNILKATKTGAAIIEKAEKLKSAAVVKIAEQFSDEAAALAKQRFLNAFPASGQPLAVLPGAPLPLSVIKDFGIMVGNKIGKGATSFREIVKEISGEVGEAIKPHLEELADAYRQAMKKAGLKADENEIISIFNEWKIDRAKNINDSIKITSKSEIGNAGWYDRQALRQKIGQADFPNYKKHIEAKTSEDAIKFSANGEAQFLPSLHNKLKGIYREAIENAISNGLVMKDGGKWYFFHKFDNSIGFNQGKETKWIRVELTDNSSPDIHGHPTTLEVVRKHFPEVKGEK